MGRTVLPITQEIRSIEEEFSKFRRALRREDQALLDELFASARYHSAPISYASSPFPLEPILLAMLIELLKSQKALRARLETLERRPAESEPGEGS
jgi:hypothetical protein